MDCVFTFGDTSRKGGLHTGRPKKKNDSGTKSEVCRADSLIICIFIASSLLLVKTNLFLIFWLLAMSDDKLDRLQ